MKATNNRITVRAQIPLQALSERDALLSQESYIQNHITAQLADRLAEEILRSKNEAIEIQEVDDYTTGPRYQAQAELYVFTKSELQRLLETTQRGQHQ